MRRFAELFEELDVKATFFIVASDLERWPEARQIAGELAAAGHELASGAFPLRANGRAMTLRAEEGFVRVIARADNHVVLGIAAVGAGVSELASAFSLALEMGARLEDIAGTIHAHPTLGEAFHEASLKALGEALHI